MEGIINLKADDDDGDLAPIQILLGQTAPLFPNEQAQPCAIRQEDAKTTSTAAIKDDDECSFFGEETAQEGAGKPRKI